MDDLRVELQELKETSDSGPPVAVDFPTHGLPRRTIAGGIGAVILMAGSVLFWRAWQIAVPSAVTAAPTLVQLTSERRAGSGSFSPDGTQIAFSSAGEDGNNWDVWLKIVGQDERDVSRPTPGLTSIRPGPRTGHRLPSCVAPAALRGSASFPMSAPSTSSRLSEVPHAECPTFPRDFSCRGLPTARWLAVSKARVGSDAPGGIYLISVATGANRQVTFPKPGTFDVFPSFAPDGSALAYASCEGVETWPVCDVQVLSLDSELRPRGAARALTRQRWVNLGVAWTRDGRSIVYASQRDLWRVRADGSTLLSAWNWPATPRRLRRSEPRPSRLQSAIWRARHLSAGGRWPPNTPHPVNVYREGSAILSRRQAHRLRVRAQRLYERDLARRRRRIECDAIDPWPGPSPRLAKLVA